MGGGGGGAASMGGGGGGAASIGGGGGPSPNSSRKTLVSLGIVFIISTSAVATIHGL